MTNPPPSAFDRERFWNLIYIWMEEHGDKIHKEKLEAFIDSACKSNISRVLDEVNKPSGNTIMGKNQDWWDGYMECNKDKFNQIQAIKSRELGEGK